MLKNFTFLNLSQKLINLKKYFSCNGVIPQGLAITHSQDALAASLNFGLCCPLMAHCSFRDINIKIYLINSC